MLTGALSHLADNVQNMRRDFSKPIGALNPKRLADFQERFRELKVRPHSSNAHASYPSDKLNTLTHCTSQVCMRQCSAIRLEALHRVPASCIAQRMCDGTQAKLPGAPPPLEVPPFMYGTPIPHGDASHCKHCMA